MKRRIFLAVLVVLAAVFLFGWAVPVLADGGDNFRKAGQEVLAEKERLLVERKTLIEEFVEMTLADGVATGKEMLILNKLVDDFWKVKREANRSLKFYGLQTSTVLLSGLDGAVKNYYEYDGFFRNDDYGNTRAYFVRLIGHDVVVEKSGFTIAGGQLVTVIGFAILFVVGIIFLFDKKWKKAWGLLYLGGSIGILAILFFA